MGQAIVFRTKARAGVIVTKTFRLWKNTDGFEVELKFESPDKERSVVYNLLGPARHPDRRRMVHRHVPRRGLRPGRAAKVSIVTYSAYDVANAKDKPIENTQRYRFGSPASRTSTSPP